MATTYNGISLEKKHFNNFRQYFPRISELCPKTLDVLIDMGVIQVSTAFELAVANVADIDVISANAYDLSDGSDGKLSTCRHTSYGRRYGAPVSNTTGKTGTLRVQVYEGKLDKFYYFVIPYTAHSMITGKSNIEIPFSMEGVPSRNYRPAFLPNWWNYEVATFEEMCKKTY